MINDEWQLDHEQDPAHSGMTDEATLLAIMRAIGDLLRRARLASGLKLADLAELCRISKSVLSRIERSKRPPSLPIIVKICATLGIRSSDLFRAAEDAAAPLPGVWRDGRLRELLDEELAPTTARPVAQRDPIGH